MFIVTAKTTRINDEIRVPQVRVIGPDGEQMGVLPIDKAQQMAIEAELDLVEIAPEAKPPVCRVMDYGKYLFEINKKKHAAKKNQKVIHIKEIKFRPGTEEQDYQVKLRNLIKFLTGGDKAKVTLRFRGRELAHMELGQKLLDRVEKDLEQYGTVEQFPKMEGKQMVMLLAPKRK